MTAKITYVRDADGYYEIFVNGIRFGSIGKTYLRLGGSQWVLNGSGIQNRGFETLTEAKGWIAKKAAA